MRTETLLEMRAFTMHVKRSYRRQHVLSASLLTCKLLSCRPVHATPHTTHLRRTGACLQLPDDHYLLRPAAEAAAAALRATRRVTGAGLFQWRVLDRGAPIEC